MPEVVNEDLRTADSVFSEAELESLRCNGIGNYQAINEQSTSGFSPLEKCAATLLTQDEAQQRDSLADIQKYLEPTGGSLYNQRRVIRWLVAWLPVMHLPENVTRPVTQSLVDLAVRENTHLRRPNYDSLDQADRLNALIATNFAWLAEQASPDTVSKLRELLLDTAPLHLLPQLEPVQLPDSLQLRFANAVDIPARAVRFVSTFGTPWEPGVCTDAEPQHKKAAVTGNAMSMTVDGVVVGVVKKIGTGDPTLLALSDVRSTDRFCLVRGGLYTFEELPMRQLSGSKESQFPLTGTAKTLSLLPLRPTKFSDAELADMQRSYQERLL